MNSLIIGQVTSSNSRFWESLRGRDVARENPEQGTNKANSMVPVPSAVNFFPFALRPPHLGGSLRVVPGFPHTRGSLGRKLRSRHREGAGRRLCGQGLESTCRVGTCLDPPASLHPEARPQRAEPGCGSGPRRRSSLWQVPQGHACPGGCKPQAKKVEKG